MTYIPRRIMATKSERVSPGEDELTPYVLANVKGLEEGEKDVDELDSGAYGIVFKVTVNKLPCMAKRLHKVLIKGVSAQEKASIQRKFRDECVLLSKLHHPNIVHFVGVCYTKIRKDLVLIMERLHTDVATFVKTHPNISISIKVSILLDVSYGLLYLHGQTPPIVHRDLTAPNVLLTSDLRAKVADLGVSKVLNDPLMIKLSTVPGNANYMAPETKDENPQYGTRVDIFALGHLALHITIQDWPKLYRVEDHRSVEDGKMEIAERKKALEEVMRKDHCLYQLTINCLQDRPEQRPSTNELNKTLKHLSIRYPTEAVFSEYARQLESSKKYSQKLEKDIQQLGEELESVQRDQEVFCTRLKSGKEAQASLELDNEFLQKQLALKKGENKTLQEKFCILRVEADLYKEDFERERKDREKARSAEQEMKEGCIRSLQSMSKDLERVTLERNDYRKRLEALESSRSEPDRTVTKQTSSKKSFYWESMKLWSRPRNALVHIKGSELLNGNPDRRRSKTIAGRATSPPSSSGASDLAGRDGAHNKMTTTVGDDEADQLLETGKAAPRDIPHSDDQLEFHSAWYSAPVHSSENLEQFSQKKHSTVDKEDSSHVLDHVSDEQYDVTKELDHVIDNQNTVD